MIKCFIKFSKKDIKKERLTSDNLEKITKFVGDYTWDKGDFFDTISSFEKGIIKGIAYTRYKDIKEDRLPRYPLYITEHNKKGEYIDVLPENVEFYETNNKIETVSLKEILSRIS